MRRLVGAVHRFCFSGLQAPRANCRFEKRLHAHAALKTFADIPFAIGTDFKYRRKEASSRRLNAMAERQARAISDASPPSSKCCTNALLKESSAHGLSLAKQSASARSSNNKKSRHG